MSSLSESEACRCSVCADDLNTLLFIFNHLMPHIFIAGLILVSDFQKPSPLPDSYSDIVMFNVTFPGPIFLKRLQFKVTLSILIVFYCYNSLGPKLLPVQPVSPEGSTNSITNQLRR